MKTKIFYRVKEMAGEKETGPVYPQCQDFIKGIDGDDYHGFFDMLDCVERMQIFPDYKPLLDGLKLAGRAKATDFLSTGSSGKIVTRKGIRALEQLNYTEHRIYPMKIYTRNVPLQYFFVAFLDYGHDAIIWDKCKFYEADLAFKTADLDSIYVKKLSDKILTFSSYEDYMLYRRSVPHYVELSEFAVNKSFDLELDYFQSSITIYEYVSERFIETYKANHLTGLMFENPIEVIQY